MWATILMEKWKRKNAELAYRWNLHNLVDDSGDDDLLVRKQFRGDEGISPVTGNIDKYEWPCHWSMKI